MIDNPCQKWCRSNKTNAGWTTKKPKESLRANYGLCGLFTENFYIPNYLLS